MFGYKNKCDVTHTMNVQGIFKKGQKKTSTHKGKYIIMNHDGWTILVSSNITLGS